MLILVTYDVSTSTNGGERRLRQVAKECVNYGQRVQKSLFECNLDPAQYKKLKAKLQELIDNETDSIRFYNMGKSYQNKIECIGVKRSYESEGFLEL